MRSVHMNQVANTHIRNERLIAVFWKMVCKLPRYPGHFGKFSHALYMIANAIPNP